MKDTSWMNKNPVFTLADAGRRFNRKAYAKLALHRLVKAGRIKRVMNGKYATSKDAFAVSSNLFSPSYVSFLSASCRYGFSEIIPRKISVVTKRRHTAFEYENYLIEFQAMTEVWGYHKEGEGNHLVFLADVEKLMIDAFLKPGEMGNLTEIENVFTHADEFNVDKLRQYLKRLGSEAVYRKVGYMLEKHRGVDIHGLFKPSRNYHQLNPFKKSKQINKKWRLFV